MDACPGPSGLPSLPTSRREFLRHAGGGFGMIALASLLAEEGLLAQEPAAALNPLTPGPTPSPAGAQRVFFLFRSGGPSHLVLFDPRPALRRLEGRRWRESSARVPPRRRVERNRLLGTRRTF